MTEVEQISTMQEEMNRLRGRLFETVEGIGLPERQEDAVKRMLRRSSYDCQVKLEQMLRRDAR